MPAFRPRHLCSVAAALALTVTAPATAATAAADASLRQVLFVGNNWDGTATVLNASGDFAKVGQLNVIPDKDARIAEINADPIKWIYYTSIRNEVGQGHDQYVDDMYSTPDGKSVVVSRPSFADVVSIDLATDKINWRFPVAGYRADHMAVSPDGTKVAVSASTANKVQVLDIVTGKELGEFATGDKPHENVFSPDGKYIWNMAIGEVTTSLDDPAWDWAKGDRHITVADATTYQQVKIIDMRDRLDAIGLTDFSDAVRPAAFTPDWSKMYFQVSFFNGFLEYDIASDKITRVKTLPANPATSTDRTTWLLDSRHHGISMKPDGTKLCVAGTMDNYATIVDRATLQEGPLITASTPYWATVSGDGKDCVISEAGADQVTAIDFGTGQKVTSIAVGDHPQRVRLGHVQADWTGASGS
ncbi:YncE family protein [Streptomyces fuscichromogenes]|uniref:YncE family protein n=1 Tax=Streptomyces fuscichromogenes TaxID=1324013 RepID=UPI0038045A7B